MKDAHWSQQSLSRSLQHERLRLQKFSSLRSSCSDVKRCFVTNDAMNERLTVVWIHELQRRYRAGFQQTFTFGNFRSSCYTSKVAPGAILTMRKCTWRNADTQTAKVRGTDCETSIELAGAKGVRKRTQATSAQLEAEPDLQLISGLTSGMIFKIIPCSKLFQGLTCLSVV